MNLIANFSETAWDNLSVRSEYITPAPEKLFVRVGIMTRQLSVCPFSQEEIAGSPGLATKNEEDKISSIPSSSLLLQGDWTGCRTGSGEKLSRSQATQGQAIR